MHKSIKLIAFLGLMSLAACGGRSTPEQRAAASAKQQEADMVLQVECRMYAAAYNLAGVQNGKAEPSILEGCPNAPKQRRDFAINGISLGNIRKSAQLISSGSVNADDVRAAYGDQGVELFKKMIVRGTPRAVARQIVGTPEFIGTIQAYQSYRAKYR